jgi:hypothetical protein
MASGEALLLGIAASGDPRLSLIIEMEQRTE